MSRKTISAVLLAAASSPAVAAGYGTAYGAVDYSYLTYDEDGFDDLHPSAVRLRLGADLHRYFGIELQGAFGVADDSLDYMGYEVELDVDSYLGVYGKGMLPVTDRFSLYGLAGYASTKAKAKIPELDVSESDTGSGFSYGGGLDFKLGERLHLTADVMQIVDDGASLMSYNGGVRYDFD